MKVYFVWHLRVMTTDARFEAAVCFEKKKKLYRIFSLNWNYGYKKKLKHETVLNSIEDLTQVIIHAIITSLTVFIYKNSPKTGLCALYTLIFNHHNRAANSMFTATKNMLIKKPASNISCNSKYPDVIISQQIVLALKFFLQLY